LGLFFQLRRKAHVTDQTPTQIFPTKNTGSRVARVSDADAAAFKAEAPAIRKALKAIKRDRQDQSFRIKNSRTVRIPISAAQIEALHARLAPIRERLRYLHGILMADERRIRAPVRLWDVWHRFRNAVDFDTGELEYLAEREGLPVPPRVRVTKEYQWDLHAYSQNEERLNQ
jgi:hypothetical protein